ncbi:hypothetical protein TNCV_2891301 [Trichonephila clavipes]|nr:hypothetical protein TNCV_2891301 [Trichonephila clavipes]
MNVCLYVIDELKNYCTDSEIGIWRIFHGKHLIPSATRRFINSKASRRSCIIMPPKRRAIGRSTPQARKRRALRPQNQTSIKAAENLRVHATETRSSESSDQREVRLETQSNTYSIRTVLF